MAKYAPKNEQGLAPYVRELTSWGRTNASIVWAENITEAKREHGYTQMRLASVKVRRATPEDMPQRST